MPTVKAKITPEMKFCVHGLDSRNFDLNDILPGGMIDDELFDRLTKDVLDIQVPAAGVHAGLYMPCLPYQTGRGFGDVPAKTPWGPSVKLNGATQQFTALVPHLAP